MLCYTHPGFDPLAARAFKGKRTRHGHGPSLGLRPGVELDIGPLLRLQLQLHRLISGDETGEAGREGGEGGSEEHAGLVGWMDG